MASAALLPDVAGPAAETPAPTGRPAPWSWGDRAALLLTLAAALTLAVLVYLWFLRHHRSLWDSSTHDRNAHYLFALKLATAARQGRVLDLAQEIDGARVWPPLYGLVTAGVLL